MIRSLETSLNICCLLPYQGLFTGTALRMVGQTCIPPTRKPVILVMTASLSLRYKHMLLKSVIVSVSASSALLLLLLHSFLFLVVVYIPFIIPLEEEEPLPSWDMKMPIHQEKWPFIKKVHFPPAFCLLLPLFDFWLCMQIYSVLCFI